MESNYIIALNYEWEKLIKICPEDIADRLEVDYDKNNNQFTVLYYQEDYIIDLKKKLIYKINSLETISIIDSIIILNYLTHSTFNISKSDKWLSLKELPNGGALFYPAFHKSSIQNIIKNFGNNLANFEKSAKKLNGKQIEYGDRGFVFNILPQISIAIIVWEGDDEASPNASILFQSSIQYLLHIETIIGVGMNLVDRLININI